jgi:isoamylase
MVTKRKGLVQWLCDNSPWLIERSGETCTIPLHGHIENGQDKGGHYNPMWVDWQVIVGVPHDVPVAGYGGHTVNYLRSYSARASDEFDMQIFNEGDYVRAVERKIAYESAGRAPYHSINFVTCRDGFTLADLVSYNQKHNEANGENNCDGASDNCSWNCETEGPTGRADIVQLRQRQMKNAVTLLLFSHGVPMLLFGDEIGRTQGGNNNLYCHDGEQSWVDWHLASENEHLLTFFRELNAFRHAHPALRRSSFVPESGASAIRMEWHGTRRSRPDWSVDSHSLALHLSEFNLNTAVDHIYLMLNAFWEPLAFDLPAIAGSHWTRVVDTSALPPRDIAPPGFEERLPSQNSYLLQPRSTVVLLGKPGEDS